MQDHKAQPSQLEGFAPLRNMAHFVCDQATQRVKVMAIGPLSRQLQIHTKGLAHPFN
jgi:hypothetical protein